MNRCGKLVLALLAISVTAPSLAREPVTLALLKDRAAADAATPEGKAYLKEFFTNPWRLAMNAAGEQCRAASMHSDSPEAWVLALSIGDNGYPTDALVSPGNDGLECMADRLRTTAFIKPPHDGFAIYMPYRRTEPGTENRPAAPADGQSSRQ